MTNQESPLDIQARVTMQVIRKDGTVEDVDVPWEGVSEADKEKLLQWPSFREWLKSQREAR